jgi:predicted GNAT family acetyltransferase
MEKNAMGDSDEDDCMIVQVTEPAIRWNPLKRPKIEGETQTSPPLASPSSSAAPSSRGVTQVNPAIAVKEELEYFPTARPNTNLAQIARLLASQLDAQTQPVEAQAADLQAQIAALTTQLQNQSLSLLTQLETKEAEFQRERIARRLAEERAEARIKAMTARLDETNRHRQNANLAHQTQCVELERVNRELQLVQETNVALATEKMAQEDKIAQLEIQLSGDTMVEPDGKGKTPIGSRGKVIRAEDLLSLTDWLPPVQTLEQAYRWDRELFYLLVNVQPNDELSPKQVERVWKKACTYSMENLFAEILVRGELSVENPAKTYWLLGDLAARVLLYHAESEAHQSERRLKESAMAKTVRQISHDNWTIPIMEGFNQHQGQWQTNLIVAWKTHLIPLVTTFEQEGWITTTI